MALAVQISSYEELEKVIQDSEKEYDQERIRAAYQLAVEKHGDQKRSSGEPISSTPCLWRPSWWAWAWIPNR